jgi:DNA-binding CsgD family transcriptional regulator
VRAAVLTMRGWTLILRGKAHEARPVLAEAFRLADGLDRLGPDWPWLHILLRTRIPLGEFEQARAENTELFRRAQDAGALATVSAAGLLVADAAFRLGDWEAADAAALQTFQLAEDVGHRHMAGWALTIRTRILAAQGRSQESRAAAATALAIAESDRISTGLRFVHGALGFLELGLDRIDAAICELETVEGLTEGSGHEEPVIVPWVPDLVEAYARQGRTGDARRVLARLERQAACTASPVAAAAAARCRGLLDDDFDTAFAGALAFDDWRPMPFERARTLLAFGRRLHRSCRRAAARQHLRAALDGFERLHADAWAGQAEAELRAAGGRRRPPQDDHALTPQERRVAAAVQRGASNRAIAADLFLSPKTVEFHLRQIYRKLDVHSRTQLVAALAEKDTAS